MTLLVLGVAFVVISVKTKTNEEGVVYLVWFSAPLIQGASPVAAMAS